MLSSALKKRDNIQFEQGIEKGIQKGMYSKAVETAKALLKEKMAIGKIACVTDLSIDEIKKLKSSCHYYKKGISLITGQFPELMFSNN